MKTVLDGNGSLERAVSKRNERSERSKRSTEPEEVVKEVLRRSSAPVGRSLIAVLHFFQTKASPGRALPCLA